MTGPSGFPTRPDDLPVGATLDELVAAHHRHGDALVDAVHGIGDPLPAEMLTAHALAALATQHALAERAMAGRWCTVRDALVFGATRTQVAAGMGLTIDEVVFGLRSWAEGQLRERLMTPAQHTEVQALVADADGAQS